MVHAAVAAAAAILYIKCVQLCIQQYTRCWLRFLDFNISGLEVLFEHFNFHHQCGEWIFNVNLQCVSFIWSFSPFIFHLVFRCQSHTFSPSVAHHMLLHMHTIHFHPYEEKLNSRKNAAGGINLVELKFETNKRVKEKKIFYSTLYWPLASINYTHCIKQNPIQQSFYRKSSISNGNILKILTFK